MEKIRILLAEDHTIVRKGILALLDDEPDIEVVGEAENGQEALRLVEELMPDLVLLDNAMPILNGLEVTRQIQKRFASVKVLVLTMHSDEAYALPFLQSGAGGYVLKQAAPRELVNAIRVVFQGDSYLSPSISKMVLERYLQQTPTSEVEDKYETLTDRERQIFQMFVEGHAAQDIADQLVISVKTVNNHRSNIMRKLNMTSTAKLVKFAIRRGIISLDE